MKRPIPAFFPVLLLSVILFAGGFFVFTGLFDFFEPTIDGILLQVPEPFKAFRTSLLFSLVLAFIPVLLILIWRFAPIVSSAKKIASVITVFIFIAIAILLRHQMVKTYFTRVVKPIVSSHNNTNFLYPIDPINFVYYITAGLCIGCTVSWFLFRQNKA